MFEAGGGASEHAEVNISIDAARNVQVERRDIGTSGERVSLFSVHGRRLPLLKLPGTGRVHTMGSVIPRVNRVRKTAYDGSRSAPDSRAPLQPCSIGFQFMEVRVSVATMAVTGATVQRGSAHCRSLHDREDPVRQSDLRAAAGVG